MLSFCEIDTNLGSKNLPDFHKLFSKRIDGGMKARYTFLKRLSLPLG